MANEKRLIDANALCEGLVENHPVVIYARNAPTVDAVEVVRCKDCKNWNERIRWCDQHSHFDDDEWNMFSPVDFCSFGERRTDG